ncbi:FAD-dependent oxidoreductase [Bradyrhizobium sp. CB3481]|uniref:NAD(P)/FAD-dependent oxidoreductase n=1 Tax=Bradyrhizobium sp. CB3481 TaxID=3039158 RepID=UPI0032C215A6
MSLPCVACIGPNRVKPVAAIQAGDWAEIEALARETAKLSTLLFHYGPPSPACLTHCSNEYSHHHHKQHMANTKHIAIIGAGIVGAVTALELARRGHRVTIIEPGQPGGEHAASYGNGGWLSPSLVVPHSLPGLWRKLPGYLLNPIGPLTIRWRHLPRLAPWLIRFLVAGFSVQKVEKTARALHPLVADCHLRHDELAAEAGVSDLIERKGQLQVYRSRADFEAEGMAWHLRRLTGCTWTELSTEEIRRREPTLDPRYNFGVVLDGYNCVKPGLYVAALVRRAVSLGVEVKRARALGFRSEGDRAAAVVTDAGNVVCDEVVISAGIHSKALAAAAGDRVSLEAERGYHVEISDMDPLPTSRVLLMDGRMTTTPSRFGLRITGHVEFSHVNEPADWRHAEVLKSFTIGAYRLTRNPNGFRFWMGSRPSTPDYLPVIGRASRLSNVIHAFGHGHIGVASSPNTARAVADLIDNRPPPFELAPYSPQRFSFLGRLRPVAPGLNRRRLIAKMARRA